MTTYIWQQPSWPSFCWDASALLDLLAQVRRRQGMLLAHADAIGLMAQADLFAAEAVTTAAIEGETLDPRAVRSSVAKQLGLPTAGLPASTRPIDGLVEVLIDATTRYAQPLNASRLKAWHAALFPGAHSGLRKIVVGQWRPGRHPMQIVSGAIGRERVHFEAPPADRIARQIQLLLRWWRSSSLRLDGLVRAGIAHLWFVTIHPFEDGNGRIARAMTDMALAQDEKTGRRLYSMSTQIAAERRCYYDVLEETQRGSGDITAWLNWFLSSLFRAFDRSEQVIAMARAQAMFWQMHAAVGLTDEQRKVILRLFAAGPAGFGGGLTNRKYVSLTRVSPATAKRELADLVRKRILAKNPAGGRSTSYRLIWPELRQHVAKRCGRPQG